MTGKTLTFTLRSPDQAKQAYNSGLRHKILTLPEEPGVTEGDRVEVVVKLTFSGVEFPLPGQVAHSGAMATIVQLDFIPAELYEAVGVEVPMHAMEQTLEETLDAERMEQEWPSEETSVPEVAPPDVGETVRSAEPATGAPPSATSGAVFTASTLGEVSAGSTSLDDSSGTFLDDAPPPPPVAPKPKPAPAAFARPTPAKQPPPAADKPKSGGYVSARAANTPAQPPPPGEGVPVPGTPNQVFAGKPSRAGSLARVSMREVFMEILKRKGTGLLVVDGFRERYWGYFVGGQPVRYNREPASRSESIEYQASRQRLLKPAELERARYAAGLTGLLLDDALVKLGMLNRRQVDGLMLESATMITDRLLGVNFGHFRYFDLPEIRKLFPGKTVDVSQVLWTRSRARYSGLNEKQVREIVDQFYKHHLVLTDQGRDLAGPLIASLAGQEKRFLQRYLRGGWQLSELLGRLEMPTRSLVELVLALQDLGAIELNEREGERWRESRAERFVIDRMDYMDRDHFAFVESHWSCLEPELMRACDKVARTIESPIMEHLELEELTQMRQEIREKLAEVRGLFADTTQRRAYRGTLIEDDKRRMAGELFHKQGEMELFKADIPKATECFQRVIELDPGGSGSGDRIVRARKVLKDLAAGINATAQRPAGMDEDFSEVLPEDLDNL